MGRRKKKRKVDPHHEEYVKFLKTYKLCGYEIFYLYFYGVNVFLCVGEIDYNGVYVYEVDTHYYEEYGVEGLMWNSLEGVYEGKNSYDCYVIDDGADNSYLGKALRLRPVIIGGEVFLPITVRVTSKLYIKASQINKGRTLPVGVYYAKKIAGGTNQEISELLETGFETKVIPWGAASGGIPQA